MNIRILIVLGVCLNLVNIQYCGAATDFSINYYKKNEEEKEDKKDEKSKYINYYLIGFSKGAADVRTDSDYYGDITINKNLSSLDIYGSGFAVSWVSNILSNFQQIKFMYNVIENTVATGVNRCKTNDGDNEILCDTVVENTVYRLSFLSTFYKKELSVVAYSGLNLMLGIGYNQFTTKVKSSSSRYNSFTDISTTNSSFSFDVLLDWVIFKKLILTYINHNTLSGINETNVSSISLSYLLY